jgi:hypothetical protein
MSEDLPSDIHRYKWAEFTFSLENTCGDLRVYIATNIDGDFSPDSRELYLRAKLDRGIKGFLYTPFMILPNNKFCLKELFYIYEEFKSCIVQIELVDPVATKSGTGSLTSIEGDSPTDSESDTITVEQKEEVVSHSHSTTRGAGGKFAKRYIVLLVMYFLFPIACLFIAFL